ncbi:hypothetical protein NPIL_167801 [Nephila pilipes]|uniref:Uncharacterized protein n=1 Tax=Nephila pilipes TaxID=299642 RepID=A0A8X6NLS9_NEPPI|nr:hypothetical protein NPIL_167801 [Nephila pilipes]
MLYADLTVDQPQLWYHCHHPIDVRGLDWASSYDISWPPRYVRKGSLKSFRNTANYCISSIIWGIQSHFRFFAACYGCCETSWVTLPESQASRLRLFAQRILSYTSKISR